jgi:rubrerythrin
MLDNEVLAGIKAGMKGELDSVTVYENAAKSASGEVKQFFEERAATEKLHFNYLLDYYKTKTINLNPERNAAAELQGGWKSAIISEAFIKQLASSRQLSAAVAAALHLEADAMRLYRDWAGRAQSPELKKLLITLGDWEERHYADLLLMQEQMERYYFAINNFEPF